MSMRDGYFLAGFFLLVLLLLFIVYIVSLVKDYISWLKTKVVGSTPKEETDSKSRPEPRYRKTYNVYKNGTGTSRYDNLPSNTSRNVTPGAVVGSKSNNASNGHGGTRGTGFSEDQSAVLLMTMALSGNSHHSNHHNENCGDNRSDSSNGSSHSHSEDSYCSSDSGGGSDSGSFD